jgi:hypothetical protein
LRRSTIFARRLSRPFGRIHRIVGEEEEMRRHPSIMDRAPTGELVGDWLVINGWGRMGRF